MKRSGFWSPVQTRPVASSPKFLKILNGLAGTRLQALITQFGMRTSFLQLQLSSPCVNLQRFGVRALQTSADSTQLSSQPGGMSEPFTVTLDQDSFRSYRTDIPPLDVSVTKEGLIEWYKQMATMRRMEQAADALYRAKLIRGFCHLAIGQVSPT